jgi:adenylate kinase family enzyme
VDRIAIIGCGGSGKSRMARVLGRTLGITPVHLDGVYYDQDWKPLDKEQFAALQRDLVAKPRWIIDGNYASSMPIRLESADTVILLNLPASVCLWGIIQRRLRHSGGQHDTIGVYNRITWNFIRYITGYRKHMAPRRPPDCFSAPRMTSTSSYCGSSAHPSAYRSYVMCKALAKKPLPASR